MNDAPNPSPTEREEAIFNGAILLPKDKIQGYLHQVCGDDQALFQRVEALLRAHEQGETFMTPPAVPPPSKTIVVSVPLTEKPGDRIGRYKLLQAIGEGGCGVVYMAEQVEPVSRRVALKVIKLGMDTKQVVARFEAERQALALMDHPNIAKVLDAGATETGRPFFVMELVRGIKITDYCDQNKLSTRERLELFVQVCQAIQHAHQKGIIHRDIKPSNILVTLHDGVPVPKVIDFGIAKATQGRLTDQTLFTAFEQFIGTPAYMSPEQAEMSGLDIDTRCDVYALGVLLYELLTGQTPFDARELLASGIDKMRQTIREREPQRPSTRLQTMVNADLTLLADHYRTDAPRLISLVQGDLDWIVMKALEKDRTRRFETANALARDIQHYLQNEPVEARPPSSAYRLQKLIRRNKLAFAAGAAVLAALVLGLGLSMAMFIRERDARRRANEAEAAEARLRKHAEERSEIGDRIGLSALYLTQAKYDMAEAAISPVPLPSLTNLLATAFLFNAFGEVHARRGEWMPAITNYAKVAAIAPKDFPAYGNLGDLYLQTKNHEAWENECQSMLGIFGQTRDPVIANTIAEICLALPPTPVQLDTTAKLLDVAMTNNSPHKTWNDVYFVDALAQYRLGRFVEATNWANKATEPNEKGRWCRKVANMVVLAMAQSRLGQNEEARRVLTEAIQTADRTFDKLDDGLDREWGDWIIAHCLMNEAQGFIKVAGSASDSVKTNDWQAAFRQAGFKLDAEITYDGSWEIDLDDQHLTNLEPLRGVKISRLSLMHTDVTDLGPLQGTPLKWLQLGGSKVTDLRPLEGMSLAALQLSGTKTTDISPLHGMPMRSLLMTGCQKLTNMEVLATMPSLEFVTLPPHAENYECLRGRTNLARLSFKYDSKTRQPSLSASEFWEKYDQAKAPKQTP